MKYLEVLSSNLKTEVLTLLDYFSRYNNNNNNTNHYFFCYFHVLIIEFKVEEAMLENMQAKI